jgi:hypothetical protein
MGQQQTHPKTEMNSLKNSLKNSFLTIFNSYQLVRQERPEDPNVWKPKHASKSNEWKENPEKAGTEV